MNINLKIFLICHAGVGRHPFQPAAEAFSFAIMAICIGFRPAPE
jgi:hypothetical protein